MKRKFPYRKNLILFEDLDVNNVQVSSMHWVKSVRIRSYSVPHFPAFGLNKERYGVSLHIQSECGKMQKRITPNTDTFYAVISSNERDDKHFIGYKDDDDDYKIKPLHIMLPKTSAYVKGCDGETKSIF